MLKLYFISNANKKVHIHIFIAEKQTNTTFTPQGILFWLIQPFPVHFG